MKNQTDIICGVSAFVVALIAFIVIYSTQPVATKPADPAPVDTSNPKAPAADVVFANNLPGASSQGGGFGGRGGFGGMMGGFGGPMGGRGGMPGGIPGVPGGMPGGVGKKFSAAAGG